MHLLWETATDVSGEIVWGVHEGNVRRGYPLRCYSRSMSSYVERRGQDFMLVASRVSLASLISAWKDGLSPETIRDDFPTLQLEQVYGAIAFYLANQTEVDSHIASLAVDFERRRAEQEALQPELTARLRLALQASRR
jgi:uncharacterized protein (DUF433 family)